jgi:hypothetical protein
MTSGYALQVVSVQKKSKAKSAISTRQIGPKHEKKSVCSKSEDLHNLKENHEFQRLKFLQIMHLSEWYTHVDSRHVCIKSETAAKDASLHIPAHVGYW